MDLLTQEDLQELTETRAGPHISIYLPTHEAGPPPETDENRITLRNFLAEAEEQLIVGGMRAPEARKLLEPARELLNDRLVWQYLSEGLALFLNPDYRRAFRLPLSFEPLLVVDGAFHLSPLIPMVSADALFYVLALSQEQIRIFGGTDYTLQEIDPENLPENMREALGEKEPQQPIFMRMGLRVGRQRMAGGKVDALRREPIGGLDTYPSVFQGQPYEQEETKKRVRKFFNWLENELEGLLLRQHAPLILAGEERVMHLYREISDYPSLEEEGIETNIKVIEAADLHRRAWDILTPHVLAERQEQLTRYQELAANAPERTTTDLKELLPSAHFERVDTLFIERGKHVWGTFDPESNELQYREESEPGAVDLLAEAALHTFLNGGDVYLLDEEQMPVSEPAAAMLRYAGEFPVAEKRQ